MIHVRLKIRHNMEIAHRLSLSPGKCQQIHGHGMQVELTLFASAGPEGMAMNSAQEVLEFGEMKKQFRSYIDSTYDHRLVLNKEDPFAGPIFMINSVVQDSVVVDSEQKFLPGLSLVDGDPTVENLARWIAEWACINFFCDVICSISETATNGASVQFHWNGFGASMVR